MGRYAGLSLLIAAIMATSAMAATEPPAWTAQVGLGNDYGWAGAQVERYIMAGRVSAFAGLGAASSECSCGGRTHETEAEATYAVGIRGYIGGTRHRGFTELSYSLVAFEWRTRGPELVDVERKYGPAVQVGYQRLADSGFTLQCSAGFGAIEDSAGDSSLELMLGLGLGYTWR